MQDKRILISIFAGKVKGKKKKKPTIIKNKNIPIVQYLGNSCQYGIQTNTKEPYNYYADCILRILDLISCPTQPTCHLKKKNKSLKKKTKKKPLLWKNSQVLVWTFGLLTSISIQLHFESQPAIITRPLWPHRAKLPPLRAFPTARCPTPELWINP